MYKVTILLPTHYNDGKIVEDWKTENSLNDIARISGGYTLEDNIIGCFTMSDGTSKREVNRKIWVVCDKLQVSKLRILAIHFADDFRQESIFFQVELVNVEFIGGK